MTNFHKSRIKNSLDDIGMKWWWFLIIFFIAVIQTTFFKYFEINGVVPNILLVLAVLFIIFYDFGDTWPHLIFTGFILDVFSDFRMGTNLTALMATAAIFHLFIKDFLNRKSVFPCIFLGFLGLIIFYLFSAGLAGLFMKLEHLAAAGFARSVIPIFFTGVIYNFFVFVPFFVLWRQFTPLETHQH